MDHILTSGNASSTSQGGESDSQSSKRMQRSEDVSAVAQSVASSACQSRGVKRPRDSDDSSRESSIVRVHQSRGSGALASASAARAASSILSDSVAEGVAGSGGDSDSILPIDLMGPADISAYLKPEIEKYYHENKDSILGALYAHKIADVDVDFLVSELEACDLVFLSHLISADVALEELLIKTNGLVLEKISELTVHSILATLEKLQPLYDQPHRQEQIEVVFGKHRSEIGVRMVPEFVKGAAGLVPECGYRGLSFHMMFAGLLLSWLPPSAIEASLNFILQDASKSPAFRLDCYLKGLLAHGSNGHVSEEDDFTLKNILKEEPSLYEKVGDNLGLLQSCNIKMEDYQKTITMLFKSHALMPAQLESITFKRSFDMLDMHIFSKAQGNHGLIILWCCNLYSRALQMGEESCIAKITKEFGLALHKRCNAEQWVRILEKKRQYPPTDIRHIVITSFEKAVERAQVIDERVTLFSAEELYLSQLEPTQ